MGNNRKVKVIHNCDPVKFEQDVNSYLADGWKVSSTNCCAAIDSHEYDFAPAFVAILVFNGVEQI